MGSIRIKSGGTWRTAKSVHTKVSGTWRAAKEVWVKSSGVWRKAWTARTVVIAIRSKTFVNTGVGGNRYDRLTFGIDVSDGVTPTSYEWPSIGIATATAIFDGPTYNPGGFTRQQTDTVTATIVVDGQTYSPSLDFTYTAGDDV